MIQVTSTLEEAEDATIPSPSFDFPSDHTFLRVSTMLREAGLENTRQVGLAAGITVDSSYHRPRFKKRIFFQMLLFHLTYPICIPIVRILYGDALLKNIMFLPLHPSKFGFKVQMPAFFVVVFNSCCFAFGFPHSLQFSFELGVPLFLIFWHRFVVALKYAFATDDFLKRMLREDISYDELFSQMLVDWGNGNLIAIRNEVETTRKLLNLDFHLAPILSEESEVSLKRFFKDESDHVLQKREDGKIYFCLGSFQQKLLELVFSQVKFEVWNPMIFLTSLILTVAPLWDHFITWNWSYFGDILPSTAGITITVIALSCAMTQTFALSFVGMRFFAVLAIDLTRRKKLMEILKSIIQIPSPKTEFGYVPEISLFYPQNVVGWFALRKFFMVILF